MEVGTVYSDLRSKYSQIDFAIIDQNNDGKFNYGKTSGDTIKVFDWENKKAVGYHLVKYGENINGTNAGDVDITKTGLGYSLKKTFNGLTDKQIKQIYPNSFLVDVDKDNKFTPGDTIVLKSSDNTRHNIHFVKDGEVPAKILQRTAAKDMGAIKSDRGIFAGEVVWHDVK